ncbi:MAG: hemerythrin domain-containing protein [Burkholderiales bacterium]|nr:hemerythrin domain-containing protein [Burkholderiales bacterium]MDR4517377.1 hemerythrin domain-containing protein [Nitrosomonas sp.]
MKRIAALKALSIDHHHGLVLARKAKMVGTAGLQPNELQEIRMELRSHAETVLISHFEIEESCIAAALNTLNDPDIDQLINRLYREHEALRQLFSSVDICNTAHLKQLGELLEQHIRFEERELFEVAQTRLDDQALQAIAAACSQENDK